MLIQQSCYIRAWDNKLIFDESSAVLKIKSLLHKQKFLYETARRFYHAVKKKIDAAGKYDIDKILKSY